MDVTGLIFDRTQADVIYAKNNPSSREYLKGALNNIDLNRIEYWCRYIADVMNTLGFTNSIQTVKNIQLTTYNDLTNYEYQDFIFLTYNDLTLTGGWEKDDILYIEDLNTIRQNIKTLRDIMNVDTDIEINIDNSIDYIQVNNMEKVLYDLKVTIENLTKGFAYTGAYYASTQEQLTY